MSVHTDTEMHTRQSTNLTTVLMNSIFCMLFLRPHTTAAHLLYNRSFYSAQRIDNVRMFGSFLPPLQSMPYDRRNEPPHNYLKYYQ